MQALDVQALNVRALDVQALNVRALDVQALNVRALDVQALDVQALKDPTLNAPRNDMRGVTFQCAVSGSRGSGATIEQ